jgi:hypothetical protein
VRPAEATHRHQRDGGRDARPPQAALLGDERQDAAKRGGGLLRACPTNTQLSAQRAPATAHTQAGQVEKDSVLQLVMTLVIYVHRATHNDTKIFHIFL